MELKNLKGTTDFSPSAQIVRNNIIQTLKNNFEKYGYAPLETPILNYFDLLAYKYHEGAEILNEIYTTYDQAKRKIGLRYDLTVPFCKYIGLNQDLVMPFRRYEIGRVFRDGPVKLGRAREFYQCDIDVVGIDGRYIEIEQMQMVKSVFDQLNIDIEIVWNNRKLMTGLLLYLNIDEQKIDMVIGLLDRLSKISNQELKSEFEKLEINNQTVDKILDLFSKTLQEYTTLFENTQIEVLNQGIIECNEITQLISQLGLKDCTTFSPTLARGLGIYTGTVFEFFDKQKRISSSLGGGGRYNKIITDFMDNGQEYPACGLCFGLEPIYAILSQKEDTNQLIDVFIVPMGTEVECMQLANTLRKNNINTTIEMRNKKVKKSFEYANKVNIPYVLIVGSNELESGLFALKDMKSGNQQNFTLQEIITLVKTK